VTYYLADTSAWNRSGRISDRWSTLVETGRLLLCVPVRLELLYSARKNDYDGLARDLDGFTHLPLDARAEAAALRAQQKLATTSQHRGPAVTDLLIAGIAEANDVVLLHYDRHLDVIARTTGQPAQWLAKRGSLD
jgi:predicted nucleic acid-binding protein